MNLEEKFNITYSAIFDLPLCVQAKRMTLESAIEWEKDFPLWEIVGITRAALETLQEKSFSDFKGVQRAHVMSRKERGILMFDRPEPMKDAYKFFFEHDVTILATKAENDLHQLGDVVSTNSKIFGRPTFSVYMTKRIKEHLNQLAMAMADAQNRGSA